MKRFYNSLQTNTIILTVKSARKYFILTKFKIQMISSIRYIASLDYTNVFIYLLSASSITSSRFSWIFLGTASFDNSSNDWGMCDKICRFNIKKTSMGICYAQVPCIPADPAFRQHRFCVDQYAEKENPLYWEKYLWR